MVRIIHAADFHLDSAFSGLPPEKARQRRRESREILDRLTALARERQVDMVLLSGDLFDGERVYPETVERLREALAALACPVFIAPGNHDPFTPRSPYARQTWPENVHIFRGGALEAVELPELGCVVHGAAFTAPERTDQVLAGFAAPADGLVHILCLHGEVNAPASQYGPITREQIAASGLTYLALGHVHQCSGLQRQGDSFWAYPGCPEGRGFDELGDKGVLAGTVERGRVSLDFVPLCRRRYHILTADVTGRNPRKALEEAMPATASDDVCRVIFTGETGEAGIDLAGLTGDYRDRFYALELRDQTRVSRDIWDRAGEDSLRGLFLRELRARYDAAEDEAEREKIAAAVRFGLAALEGRDLG